jgi:hypothetical protein
MPLPRRVMVTLARIVLRRDLGHLGAADGFAGVGPARATARGSGPIRDIPAAFGRLARLAFRP